MQCCLHLGLVQNRSLPNQLRLVLQEHRFEFQRHLKTATKCLGADFAPMHKQRLVGKFRRRLERWSSLFGCIPVGHIVRRAFFRLSKLKGRAPPAVQAVYLRSLLNGWTTTRRLRFTKLERVTRVRSEHCVFCHQGNDSLEHLSCCHIVREFFRKHGRLVFSFVTFLGLDQDVLPLGIVKHAKLLTAVFNAHNSLSHNQGADPTAGLRDVSVAIRV